MRPPVAVRAHLFGLRHTLSRERDIPRPHRRRGRLTTCHHRANQGGRSRLVPYSSMLSNEPIAPVGTAGPPRVGHGALVTLDGVDEARLERTEYGLTAATEGWFTVNVRDAAWMTNEKFGQACVFEGDQIEFPQVGYTLQVLAPGQPNGLYHREDDQEDFLVLSGECLLIVEGEERRLTRGTSCTARPDRAHLRGRRRRAVRDLHGRRPGAPGQRGLPGARGGAASRGRAAGQTDKPYAPFPKWQKGPPAELRRPAVRLAAARDSGARQLDPLGSGRRTGAEPPARRHDGPDLQ